MDDILIKAGQCIKCGRCLAVCPVYQVSTQERFSTRGKLTLITAFLNKEITTSVAFEETIGACLMCNQCNQACIFNLDVPKIIQGTRKILWKQRRLHLNYPWILNKFLANYQRFHLGIWLRLAGLFNPSLEVPSKPFLSGRVPENSNAKVAIFIGCAINLLYPYLGERIITLFEKIKIPITIPKGQTCCGLMAYSLGDTQTAQSLAKRNVQIFRSLSVDYIIAPCASCFHHLKTYEVYQKAGISQKVIEFSQFLLRQDLEVSSPYKVTWHDPCHLRYHHNIWKEPRALLMKLGGNFVESSPNGQCCGQGGPFGLIHPKISREILKRRLSRIEASGAEAVVTTCMGCFIQLKEIGNKRVLHILDLL